MGEPSAKGLCFRSFLRALPRVAGEDAVEQTLGLLEPDLAHQIRDGLVFTGNWYPLAWYRQLHAGAQQATGRGVDLSWKIGLEATREDLTGIYRIFLLVASPEYVLSKASLLFRTYYDTGTMTVVKAISGYAHARWTGCEGFDANLWADMTGGCQAALEAAGAKAVTLKTTAGGQDGDSLMEVEAHWQ